MSMADQNEGTSCRSAGELWQDFGHRLLTTGC